MTDPNPIRQPTFSTPSVMTNAHMEQLTHENKLWDQENSKLMQQIQELKRKLNQCQSNSHHSRYLMLKAQLKTCSEKLDDCRKNTGAAAANHGNASDSDIFMMDMDQKSFICI